MVTTAAQLLVPATDLGPRVAPVLGQPEEAAGGGTGTFPFWASEMEDQRD